MICRGLGMIGDDAPRCVGKLVPGNGALCALDRGDRGGTRYFARAGDTVSGGPARSTVSDVAERR